MSEPTSFERVLASRGHGGYRQYRIPALAVTNSGTVLAAYDGRPNLDDLPNPIDLLLRRSIDSGRTWTEQQVVRTGVGLEGFGDPSLLVDHETGRLFMFHAAGTKAGFFESRTGVELVDEVQHVDLSFSDDDGVTWQHRRITDQLKATDEGHIAGLFAASGTGIQIHAGAHRGRLVQQFVLLIDGAIRAASALSDDHGETWRLGDVIGASADGVDPNENKVVCLSGGRLLWHSRAYPVRLQAISDDGGQSWSTPEPVADLPDPSDNGSVARFDGRPHLTAFAAPHTDDWLIATHNHDTALRHNTVLRLSTDNGASWPKSLVLCPGSSAYSTALRLPDGRIGVLHERQGYTEIVFASIDPQALTEAGEHAEPERALEFDVVLRSITPGRPAAWRHVGQWHVVPTEAEGVDRRAWKEVGQGYGDQGQVIGTREAQDLNYGPPRPGCRAGDLLTFAARVRVTTPQLVRIDGCGVAQERELAAGEDWVLPSVSHRVTEREVAAGEAVVTFTASAGVGRACVAHRFDTATGAVEVSTA